MPIRRKARLDGTPGEDAARAPTPNHLMNLPRKLSILIGMLLAAGILAVGAAEKPATADRVLILERSE